MTESHLVDLSNKVIGAAIEVHRILGAGCAELTYQRSMSVELGLRGIDHALEVPVELTYKNTCVGAGKIDILVEDKLVVELKTVDALHDSHTHQVLAYLRAHGSNVGLLINFSHQTLKEGIRRIQL